MIRANSHNLERVKRAVANGSLSCADIERRLNTAIDVELAKTREAADLEFIRECQSLLWELHSDGEAPFSGNMEQNLGYAKSKLNKQLGIRKVRRRAAYAVGMAAVILVLTVTIDALMRKERLEGWSTPNGQDYVVQGYVLDPSLIEKSVAGTEIDAQPRSVTTINFEEACSILSFTPPLPTWLPEGWELVRYKADSVEGLEYFFVSYKHDGFEKSIRYEVNHSQDISRLNYYHEQNEEGTMVILDNGVEAYITMNMEQIVCSWIHDNEMFTLTGPISQEEVLKIVNSTKGV